MSCIKSIQRGTGSGNAKITINPVDLNKSVALISGGNGTDTRGSWGGVVVVPRITLTDSTTLSIDNSDGSYYDGQNSHILRASYAWQVIEFA